MDWEIRKDLINHEMKDLEIWKGMVKQALERKMNLYPDAKNINFHPIKVEGSVIIAFVEFDE